MALERTSRRAIAQELQHSEVGQQISEMQIM